MFPLTQIAGYSLPSFSRMSSTSLPDYRKRFGVRIGAELPQFGCERRRRSTHAPDGSLPKAIRKILYSFLVIDTLDHLCMHFFVNSFFTKKIIEAGTNALFVKGTLCALTEPLVMLIYAPLLDFVFHVIVCCDISMS